MFSPNGPSFWELVDQALSSTQGGYDKLAPKFDATPFRTPQPIVDRSLEGLGRVERSLDLCCGTGAGLVALRRVTTERVTGVDFSPGMLEVARHRVADLPEPPVVELVERDVFDLGYEREFDLVTCFGAFGHILPADEPRFVAIIHRALRPGGRFVFVSTDHPPRMSLRHIVARGFNAAMHVRNRLVSPPFIMYYLTFMLPEVARLLRAHGFDVKLEHDFFAAPYRELVRVIATRR